MDFKLLSSQPVKAIVLCIFEAHSPPNIFSKIYNTSFLTYSQRGSKYFVCGLTKIYIYILNGTLALTLTPGGSDKCAHPLQAILMIAAIYSTIVSLLKVRYKITSNPHNHPTGKFISFLLQIKKKKKKLRLRNLGLGWGLHMSLRPTSPSSSHTLEHKNCLLGVKQHLSLDWFPSSYLFKQTRLGQ